MCGRIVRPPMVGSNTTTNDWAKMIREGLEKAETESERRRYQELFRRYEWEGPYVSAIIPPLYEAYTAIIPPLYQPSVQTAPITPKEPEKPTEPPKPANRFS